MLKWLHVEILKTVSENVFCFKRQLFVFIEDYIKKEKTKGIYLFFQY